MVSRYKGAFNIAKSNPVGNNAKSHSMILCKLIERGFYPFQIASNYIMTYFTLMKKFGLNFNNEKKVFQSEINNTFRTIRSNINSKKSNVDNLMTKEFLGYYKLHLIEMNNFINNTKKLNLVYIRSTMNFGFKYYQIIAKSKETEKYYAFIKLANDSNSKINLALIY